MIEAETIGLLPMIRGSITILSSTLTNTPPPRHNIFQKVLLSFT